MFNSTTSQLAAGSLWLALVGAACLAFLVSIPGDPANALLLGLSSSRLVLAATLAGLTLAFGLVGYRLRRGQHVPGQWLAALHSAPAFGLSLLVALLGLLVCTTWPYAALEWQASLQRLLPLALFGTVAGGTLLLFNLSHSQQPARRTLALAGLALVLGLTYWSASNHYAVVNREYWLSDQEALLSFARAVSADIGFTGTREFMPGFPLLAHGFMDARLEQAPYFAQGKLVNIGFSLLFLAGIFVFVRRYFNPIGSALFTLLAATTLFLYKAAYFQPELAYYFFSFVAFGLLVQVFQRPQPWLALLAGLLLAASHYIKASILPTVGLFLLAMLAQAALEWLQRRQPRQAGQRLLAAGLVLLAFVLPLWGYLQESKAVYGSHFYNVTTRYYLWVDSWGEAKASEQQFEYYRGVPDVPAEQLPSLQNYLKTHTAAQIAERLWLGVQNQASNWWNSYALVSFPLWLLAGLLFLAYRQRQAVWAYARQNPILCLFFLAYFAAHFVAFAWYGPIADYADRRFTYGQYLPLLLVTFLGYKHLLPLEPAQARWASYFFAAVLLVLAAHILLYMPYQFLDFHWYGK